MRQRLRRLLLLKFRRLLLPELLLLQVLLL
jgi:hypothetical protein